MSTSSVNLCVVWHNLTCPNNAPNAADDLVLKTAPLKVTDNHVKAIYLVSRYFRCLLLDCQYCEQRSGEMVGWSVGFESEMYTIFRGDDVDDKSLNITWSLPLLSRSTFDITDLRQTLPPSSLRSFLPSFLSTFVKPPPFHVYLITIPSNPY